MEQTRQRSRKGCLTCREKRKKCDEVRPICGRCRGGDDCIWPASQLASKVASRPSRLPRIQPRPSLDPRPIYTNVISDEASTTASEDSKTASSVSPHESNLNSLDMFPEMAAGPDFHELSAYCLFSASDLLPEFNDSPPVSIDNFWDHGSSLTRNYRIHLSSNSFALACDSEDGPDYALDEDEEETFKTNEWLPGTLQSIKLHLSLNVPSQDGIPWSSIVESCKCLKGT
ncbi:hypothetical protein RSOLAG1IB_02181 [Rhizoctonia solani AG-1 IB]|uniref:Zn(2)-C6 fungal-type domain-containing protein n=1 Tax=Thanatephorus cucumeris (strain AG1-IB / isolate 7/3/14) TaxID=1108050 RepID=A0A0B7FMP4_THACB|nr:hypothetical protein RSOLAG1IB_02181 [Rhizoctonia solani AG-1 IB]